MTSPVPPAALAAARAAVPFVNQDAARRILEAAAPAIEADVRERLLGEGWLPPRPPSVPPPRGLFGGHDRHRRDIDPHPEALMENLP